VTEDEIILTHILQCRAIDLVLKKPALTDSQQKLFEEYRRRRAAGEPLQYILGACNFMGLELAVDPSVLVPRPETEQLVDAAIKYIENKGENKGDRDQNGGRAIESPATILVPVPFRALDLGTGSGCIAIALAKFVPESQVVSVDISDKALAVARANAKRHGVEERVRFVQQDMSVSLRGAEGDEAISQKIASLDSRLACNDTKFDLIISNPPYIPTGQMKNLPKDVQQEPVVALDGGEDGLSFYRSIIKYSPFLLRAGGCLMMEFGDGQAQAIEEIIEAQKAFSRIEIICDLAGRERIIKVLL
jgi:release factor glutamine methyltransferase